MYKIVIIHRDLLPRSRQCAAGRTCKLPAYTRSVLRGERSSPYQPTVSYSKRRSNMAGCWDRCLGGLRNKETCRKAAICSRDDLRFPCDSNIE